MTISSCDPSAGPSATGQRKAGAVWRGLRADFPEESSWDGQKLAYRSPTSALFNPFFGENRVQKKSTVIHILTSLLEDLGIGCKLKRV